MVPRAASDLLGFAVAVVGAVAYGGTVLFSRVVAKNRLGPLTALPIRFGGAGLLLLGVVALRRRPLLPPRGERLAVLSLGALWYALESTCFFLALQRGTAAAVELLFYAYPAVILTVEVVRGVVRPRPPVVVAVALALGGATFVALAGGTVSISGDGIAFVGVAIVGFTVYALSSARLVRRTDSMTAAAWTALGVSLSLGTVGLVSGRFEDPGGSLPPILANCFVTALAFLMFFVAVGRLGASRTGVIMTLEAASAVVLAAVFLGESVRLWEGVGGAVVLAGAVIAGLSSPVRDAEQEIAPP